MALVDGFVSSVSLQTLHYLSSSFIVLILELLTGSPVTLNHVLSYPELRTDTVFGWGLFFAFILNAALGYANRSLKWVDNVDP